VRSTEDIEKRIKNVNIVIDSERNKKVFSNILQAFEKSKAKELAPTGPNIWRAISRNPITKIAAAAVIILALSFFSTHRDPAKQEQPKIMVAAKSPVEMMTAISLERAFRRGGIEAVEEQCKQAFKPIKTRPESSSIKQILAEFNFNGKSSERTRP
jgi:hypothetical protein